MPSPKQKSMSDERTVAVGGVSPTTAVDHLRSAEGYDAMSVANAVPVFEKVKLYSFQAEWALVGKDIQVKFFLPKHAKLNTPEARKAWMEYWLNRFAEKLDVTAREYFEKEYPQLVVKWTEEFQSWWFRACSYDHLLDVRAFLAPFFAKLDQSLQAPGGGNGTAA